MMDGHDTLFFPFVQRRPVPPYRHIPSQMWCKYAKVTIIEP